MSADTQGFCLVVGTSPASSGASGGSICRKVQIILLFSKILWGFGGDTPITEEEAQPDDETKDLRVSALFLKRPPADV
jgi:hypothetical protein